MPEHASVTVDGLSKCFVERVALDDISLEVRPGDVLVIVGANGSGKSSLLRMVAGILTPDSGRVIVQGRDMQRERRAAAGSVGAVLDSARCWYPRISGQANLEFHARVRGLARRDAGREAARQLAAVGLAPDGHRTVSTYSAGMRARLALARARLADPAVLLLDEPTATLDARSVSEFHRHLREADGARGVMLVTHDMEEGGELGTAAIVLHHGRVVDRIDSRTSATRLRAALP